MGKLLSLAVRLILINACLLNPPMHAMGVCMLGRGVHQTFNKHRSRFFSVANGPRRKFHWVRWEALCRPKSLARIGSMETAATPLGILPSDVPGDETRREGG
jgi:hypothetical protein